jgi:hypothetical protein
MGLLLWGESATADVLSRAVVAVQAARLSGKEQDRIQSISDLFARRGGGAIAPNQLHAYPRPDASAARPRAAALLTRGASGRQYLLTAYHVLFDPASAGSLPQESMEPDKSESDESGGEGKPVGGMAEIGFDEHALPPHLRKGLFPSESFPHLDLSLVWLDETNDEICASLVRAGFDFAAADLIEDEPSAEGVEIRVISSGALDGGEAQSFGRAVAMGHVRGLSKSLSFFWIDPELPPHFTSAPVAEGERIVGFLSPLQVNGATHLSPSFATIMKAGGIKALLAAHEAARYSYNRFRQSRGEKPSRQLVKPGLCGRNSVGRKTPQKQ